MVVGAPLEIRADVLRTRIDKITRKSSRRFSQAVQATGIDPGEARVPTGGQNPG